MDKIKKGFTIVELVIVIAVIAILAAILIPTFANIIRSANESSDSQLVRNLNTVLAADKVTGNRHVTYHEALAVVAESGYDVAKIMKAKATDNAILWDAKNDVFCYLKGDQVVYIPESIKGTTEKVELWKIYPDIASAEADTDGYSVYLAGEDLTGSISVEGRGVDVGKNAGITAVNYAGAFGDREILIRTSSASTMVTVDSERGKISHYGEAGFLNLIRADTASYHEYGYIPQAQIEEGRIVNEGGDVVLHDGTTKNAGVENLFVVAKEQGGGSAAGRFGEVIVEARSGASLPSLDRSDVNIVGAVLVVEVKTPDADDYVYLTKSGIVEQVVVSTEKGTTDTSTVKATFGTDPALNVASAKAAGEIANVALRGENGRPLKSDGETEMTAEEVAALSSVSQVTIETPKVNREEWENAKRLFAGGVGTEKNPFLIANREQLENIREFVTGGYCFRLVSDIDTTDKDWIPFGRGYYESLGGGSTQLVAKNEEWFDGIFDGNGKTVKLKHDSATAVYKEESYGTAKLSKDVALFGVIWGGQVRNLTVDVDYNITAKGIAGCGIAYQAFGTFENVTVNGSIRSTSSSAGLVYAASYSQFRRCTNNADITVTYSYTNAEKTGDAYQLVGGIAGDVVSGYYGYPEFDSVFEDCTNNGNLTNVTVTDRTPRSIMGGLYAQAINGTSTAVTVTRCRNTGSLKGYAKSSASPNAYSYPMFEGTANDGETTYQSYPNALKQLIGGYSTKGIVIDGKKYDKNTNASVLSVSGDMVMFKPGE